MTAFLFSYESCAAQARQQSVLYDTVLGSALRCACLSGRSRITSEVVGLLLEQKQFREGAMFSRALLRGLCARGAVLYRARGQRLYASYDRARIARDMNQDGRLSIVKDQDVFIGETSLARLAENMRTHYKCGRWCAKCGATYLSALFQSDRLL